MFVDGLNIMVLGMVIVFVFLIVIYLSMTLSSTLIQKFHLRFNPEPLHVVGEEETNQSELAAVISAAVAYYKN